MRKQESEEEILSKITLYRSNEMTMLRRSIFDVMDKEDITLAELSKRSNIAISTLNSLLYGNSNDCKLSTVISLAIALNLTVEELTKAPCLPDTTYESYSFAKELSENDLYLVRWFIRHVYDQSLTHDKNKRIIKRFMPTINNGFIKLTNHYDEIDITDVPKEIAAKVFCGYYLGCDYYMPFYTPFNTILIANDRNANWNEHSLILFGGSLYIVKYQVIDGVASYYSIRDGKWRCNADEIDELIGYVAYVI